MPLFGLVRRMLTHAQNKRLLKRMMVRGDKYADIRLSGATQRSSHAWSPTSSTSTSSTATTPASSAATPSSVVASRLSDRKGDRVSNHSHDDASDARSSSQSRLSASVCVVVPMQSSEAVWMDKLRSQEETYRRSAPCKSFSSSSAGLSSSHASSTRRRCDSEDDAFELWDYVCPQLVRPKCRNEWV
ncbi:hypothetical protein FI667_g9205, partial [Globisporangium splendens]